MKPTLKKELPTIAIVLLPFIYLGFIWNELPEKVPIHWNFQGEIDRYGDKTMLIVIAMALPLLTYLIFLAVPRMDPKNKIDKMGGKYQNLKLLMTVFMSVLALFIFYLASTQSLTNPNYIILGMGVLYIILGNYFKTIRPNYFLGIKTPWTLESETVWKKTHNLAGKMWFIGGIVVVLASMILGKQSNLTVFLIVTAIISLIPILYSYLQFKKESRTVDGKA